MVVVAIACAAVLAAFVLAFVAVSYERELRSMARFLEERERGSNERLTMEFSTRGIAGLARATSWTPNATHASNAIGASRRFGKTSWRFRTISARRSQAPRATCSFTSARPTKSRSAAIWRPRRNVLPRCAL